MRPRCPGAVALQTRAGRVGAVCALTFTAAFSTGAVGQAPAQNFPSHQITVLSYTAPGPSSQALKVVTDRLAERWKQTILFDFRPGANMVPAVTALLRA